MRPSGKHVRNFSGSFFSDFLTFDKLIAGQILNLVYWAGLGLVAIFGFASVGASIGIALNEESLMGWFLAFPALIIGLLITALLALVWRAFCEFFAATLRISDDLRALRQANDIREDIAPRP